MGEYTNRAVGPGAVIVTDTGAVWASAPLVPVIVTAYEPALVPVKVHVDVCVPLMLTGTHEVVAPTGTETAARSTVPVKPPLAVRLTVDVA
ncbi:MAG TPA: hypothetical protein VNP71_09010, partial [Thermoplasmata archaeon]|nr:hypothetical protein [Thermoplasmata archaeon]